MKEILLSVAVILAFFSANTNGVHNSSFQKYSGELAKGDMADLIGVNPHYSQPHLYDLDDLARRFVPQYPYTEVNAQNKVVDSEIVPELAPAAVVLNIARESAKYAKANPTNPTDEIIEKHILRTGEYWNDVWEENGITKKALRSSKKNQQLSTVKVNIPPDSQFYELLSRLQKISPKLLYIININNDDK